MSLQRAAARLAFVLALSNNFKAPFPTLAGANVYDSRNEPPSQIQDDELVPTITIYTDDDGGAIDAGNWLQINGRELDLVIELYMPVWSMSEVESGEFYDTGDLDEAGNPILKPVMVPVPQINMPDTDAELEAQLDLLEHQVKFALRNIQNKWIKHLIGGAGVIKNITSWKSGRWAEAKQSRVRFAYRVIKLSVTLPDDCPPKMIQQAGAVQVVNALPPSIQKLLAAVEQDLGTDGQPVGHVKVLVDMLRAAGVPSGVTTPPLEGMTMTGTSPDGTPMVQTQSGDLAD